MLYIRYICLLFLESTPIRAEPVHNDDDASDEELKRMDISAKTSPKMRDVSPKDWIRELVIETINDSVLVETGYNSFI